MTPQEAEQANILLRLRDTFSELADHDLHLGVFWRTTSGGTTYIGTNPKAGIIDLCKHCKNKSKIERTLFNLKDLVRDELLVLLNEFELELNRLGVDIKPIEIPKLQPKNNDSDRPQQPPESV